MAERKQVVIRLHGGRGFGPRNIGPGILGRKENRAGVQIGPRYSGPWNIGPLSKHWAEVYWAAEYWAVN